MDGMRAGDTVSLGEGDGPWAPWAFALSALAHAALLGLLIAAAETPAVPVPEAVSVDIVLGSGAEAAADAGGGPDSGGKANAEPPPATATAEPDPAPDDSPASDAPVLEVSDQPAAAPSVLPPPVPARKPAVKPVTAVTLNPSPASPAKTPAPRAEMPGEREGPAETGPSGGTANSPAPADADAAAGGGGADAMRVYLEEVRRRLQARLAVPAEARRLRLGGTVLVRFTVRRDGSVQGDSLAVLSGPGIAVLERTALETVVRTAPFPPPPRPATVEVPVLFAVSVR